MCTTPSATEFVVHSSPSVIVRDFQRPHVWICDLDADPVVACSPPVAWFPDHSATSGRSLLSASELARAERLKSLLERRRFLARCAFVRHVLGNLTGVAPAALEFHEGTHGKPRLACSVAANGRPAALGFNLSHSDNVLALAVAFGREVGIDVEVVQPGVDVLAIADAHFTAEESAWLRALRASECSLAFYRLWTRKEALAKADGRGIGSLPAVESRADSQWQLHSFAFKLGEKQIVGALALGVNALAGAR